MQEHKDLSQNLRSLKMIGHLLGVKTNNFS